VLEQALPFRRVGRANLFEIVTELADALPGPLQREPLAHATGRRLDVGDADPELLELLRSIGDHVLRLMDGGIAASVSSAS
jgi:hypothetical protein